MTAFFPVLLIISMARPYNFAPTQIEQCTVDSHCSKEHYCHMQICEPCISCETTFNRQPARSLSLEITCAKHEEDCGNCIPGFQADDWTNLRRSPKCYPIKSTAESTLLKIPNMKKNPEKLKTSKKEPTSDVPPTSTSSDSLIRILIVIGSVSFITIVAVYNYKKVRDLFSLLRKKVQDIASEILSAKGLPEDQTNSQECTTQTNPLMPAIKKPKKNKKNENEDDTYSEAYRPSAPPLENINGEDTDQANGNPAEFVPAIGVPNLPTNKFQPPELPSDKGPVETATENPTIGVVTLPPAAPNSQNPDGDHSGARIPSQGEESLEPGIIDFCVSAAKRSKPRKEIEQCC